MLQATDIEATEGLIRCVGGFAEAGLASTWNCRRPTGRRFLARRLNKNRVERVWRDDRRVRTSPRPSRIFYVTGNCIDYSGWSCDPRVTKFIAGNLRGPTTFGGAQEDRRRVCRACCMRNTPRRHVGPVRPAGSVSHHPAWVDRLGDPDLLERREIVRHVRYDGGAATGDTIPGAVLFGKNSGPRTQTRRRRCNSSRHRDHPAGAMVQATYIARAAGRPYARRTAQPAVSGCGARRWAPTSTAWSSVMRAVAQPGRGTTRGPRCSAWILLRLALERSQQCGAGCLPSSRTCWNAGGRAAIAATSICSFYQNAFLITDTREGVSCWKRWAVCGPWSLPRRSGRYPNAYSIGTGFTRASGVPARPCRGRRGGAANAGSTGPSRVVMPTRYWSSAASGAARCARSTALLGAKDGALEVGDVMASLA